MFDITTEADNTLQVLAALQDRTRDWKPALNEAALFLEAKTKENFAKQRDPDGNPWKPLAASTLAAKRRRNAPLKALIDTGTLRAGIAARPATNTQVSVETTAGAEYGIWLQSGVKPHSRARTQFFRGSYRYRHPGMPARPYIGFNQELIDGVTAILSSYLGEAL